MFEKEILALKERHLLRELVRMDRAPNHLLFSSNDYLGLAHDDRLAQAAFQAAQKFGFGAGASRLLSGNMSLHEDTERHLADFVGREAALLFPSGYQANCGAIPALVGEDDGIFSDAMNHASLIDACRLSRAQVVIFPHRDMRELERSLEKMRRQFRRCMILSESVFSMEGSLAPVGELWELAKRFDAMLYVDDAHGLGVLGKTGEGVSGDLPADERVILMGTLGKSIGAFGAFVAGSKLLRAYLINKARTFIFSTGPSPALCGAVGRSLEILVEEPWRLEQLRRNCGIFAEGVRKLGFPLLPEADKVPIHPVILGSEERALLCAQGLLERGIWVRAIRPPTVAPHTCRLRFSLMATHTPENLETALHALREVIRHGT